MKAFFAPNEFIAFMGLLSYCVYSFEKPALSEQ